MFDKKGQIQKFNSASEIIEEYFPIRRKLYTDRKDHMVKVLTQELKIAT